MGLLSGSGMVMWMQMMRMYWCDAAVAVDIEAAAKVMYFPVHYDYYVVCYNCDDDEKYCLIEEWWDVKVVPHK